MVAEGATVLVVSDNPEVIKKLTDLVQQLGYSIVVINAAAEIPDVFQRAQPYLVAIDALLPDCDPSALCQQLQRLPGGERTPVVVIGASGQDSATMERAFAAGAVDFIDRSDQPQWTALRRRIQYFIRARHTEETVERDRALLWTLINNIPDYIFAKDRQGRFLVSNEAHARASRTTPEELLGKTAFDLFPSHLAAQFDADDRNLMQSGVALVNVDRRTVDENGLERRVLTTKVPLRDSQGQVIGLVGISRDVTAYKQAQEGLAQERALLRTLIDNLPDNIFVKDTQGRIIVDNAAHCKLLGLRTAEEAVGKTDFDFFPQELAAQYFADEQAVIQSGQALINREEETVDPSGARQWLLTTKAPLRDASGDIIGLVGINRDVTDLKRLEKKLKQGEC